MTMVAIAATAAADDVPADAEADRPQSPWSSTEENPPGTGGKGGQKAKEEQGGEEEEEGQPTPGKPEKHKKGKEETKGIRRRRDDRGHS